MNDLIFGVEKVLEISGGFNGSNIVYIDINFDF